ncbi:MAG: bifunctional diaminohydroxyphosphoribosylaminopyrimidine deaminase/5-amino-6-(5-phosphoribosylamino)uracil reductase RibD [Moraxella sp.]|nr:bifunctional diaminohydroxyphosphoribosylaminopyrimidine deaminase/5-amino-6-(5-phosphoribosylamino)uracil reductase RibD [Moraxella sp.]
MINSNDDDYMALALNLAKQGAFTTRPNPAVGCVMVKDGAVIGTGFHPKAGEPHAEVFALRAAAQNGHDTTGATAYVTLEPCSHHGRTPPCAAALIHAGLSRVVIATLDPNPKVAGRGMTMLQEAGIAVDVGVGEQQAKAINAGFLKAMATGLPHVRLKIASSLDGRTAMASGESKWITGSTAREDVQRLRAKSGAIITGSGTIIADNPALSVRSTTLGVPLTNIPTPKIVVIDRSHRLQKTDDYQVFIDDNTLIWRDDLFSLLKTLVAEYQCHDVLVEAGSTLATAFLLAGLVDELIIYQAPCLLGATAQPMFVGEFERLVEKLDFELIDCQKIGDDVKLTLIPKVIHS